MFEITKANRYGAVHDPMEDVQLISYPYQLTSLKRAAILYAKHVIHNEVQRIR